MEEVTLVKDQTMGMVSTERDVVKCEVFHRMVSEPVWLVLRQELSSCGHKTQWKIGLQ